MAVCYPSARDSCGQPPFQSTLHLGLLERYDYGITSADLRIDVDSDLACAVISVIPADGEPIEVLLSQAATVDAILKMIAAVGQLEQEDEQGDAE